jgi:hypothetical protein
VKTITGLPTVTVNGEVNPDAIQQPTRRRLFSFLPWRKP